MSSIADLIATSEKVKNLTQEQLAEIRTLIENNSKN
jgi:ribosomal protein S13